MKKIGTWIARQFKQNVLGVSPPPPIPTWAEYAQKVGWDKLSEEDKDRIYGRINTEFGDETLLMTETFKKLIGVLTSLGLVIAFAAGRLLLSEAALALARSAIIFVVWALSTRLKVARAPKDPTLGGALVDDGTGQSMTEQKAADVWWRYTWRWHRHCTRKAIDLLFLIACLQIVATLLLV